MGRIHPRRDDQRHDPDLFREGLLEVSEAEDPMISDFEWNKEIKRMRELLEKYSEMEFDGVLPIVLLLRDLDLYENGDRSEALFERFKQAT